MIEEIEFAIIKNTKIYLSNAGNELFLVKK
jgi:hypothetical protein